MFSHLAIAELGWESIREVAAGHSHLTAKPEYSRQFVVAFSVS